MNDFDIIILSGGEGKRLKNITSIPKLFIKFGKKTFLEILLDQFKIQGLKNIYITSGFRKKIFRSEFEKIKSKINYNIKIVEEEIPLDTGGAILNVHKKKNLSDNIVIIYGDTFFNFSVSKFINKFFINKPDILISISKKYMTSRYGNIKFKNNNFISTIKDNKFKFRSFVFNGLCMISKKSIKFHKKKFAFDTDFLNYYSKKLRIDVDIVDKSNAFIDYGTENSLKKLNSIIN